MSNEVSNSPARIFKKEEVKSVERELHFEK